MPKKLTFTYIFTLIAANLGTANAEQLNASQPSISQPVISITSSNSPEHEKMMQRALQSFAASQPILTPLPMDDTPAPTSIPSQQQPTALPVAKIPVYHAPSIKVSHTKTQMKHAPHPIKHPIKHPTHPTLTTKQPSKQSPQPKATKEPSISSLRFDFSYHDDVANLISKLKDYDPSLQELNSLGKKLHINFNTDLTNTSIAELAISLNNQTEGKVNLVYEPITHKARLVFSSKITTTDFARDVITEAKRLTNTTKLKLVPGADGVIKMPYGGPYPVVCKPLKMCDIRLEEGEIVRGWTLSDKENWIVPGAATPQFLYSGPDNNTTPHIILKPVEAGLDSNLIVTTNKRTYNIPLQSSKDNYVTAIAYYYPDDINQSLTKDREEIRTQAQGTIPLYTSTNSAAQDAPHNSNPNTTSDTPSLVPVDSLNFNYQISGDEVNWKPVQAFDDGTHVWLKFAQNRQEYPPLFEINADGAKKSLLIYQPMPGGYYRVDSLFKQAALIIGDGTHEKKVVISKIIPEKPWYKRTFGGGNE